MDEALVLLKKLWAGEEEFQGKHFSVKGRVYPGPVQAGGPPIWVGGKIRRSVERAAKLGDAWYGATQYHLEVIKRQADRYRNCCWPRAATRPALQSLSTVRLLLQKPMNAPDRRVKICQRSAQLLRRMGLIQDGRGNSIDPQKDLFEAVGDEIVFVGSPDTCLESIRKYHKAGVTHFNFRISMGNMPLELIERSVTLLGQHVLPHFSS